MNSEIVQSDSCSLHVFGPRRGSKEMPRCHVRRRNGGAETVVELPFVEVIAGPPLDGEEIKAILEHMQELLDEWDRRA